MQRSAPSATEAQSALAVLAVPVVSVAVREPRERVRPVWPGPHRCVMVAPVVPVARVVTRAVPARAEPAVPRPVWSLVLPVWRALPSVVVLVGLVASVVPGLTPRG